jgi:prepilin-type N-terminal cleavage/methylation domain-containing protein
MRVLREESGFSLTELLVSMVLATVIFGAAVTTWVSFLKVNTKTEEQQRAQDAARSTVERLSAHIRNAMTNGSSNAVINSSSSAFNLVFVTALPGTTTTTTNPRGLTHVRYCLESRGSVKDDRLFLQTHPYSTAAPTAPASLTCPDNAWDTKQVFSDHYVNRAQPGTPALFTYRTDSATPPNITHVSIHPILDWAPNRDPEPTELTTTVNLRNLNRVPTAALTCSGLANGHAVCDGTASTDPDGEGLSYAWKLNNATITGESTSRLDKYPLVSKASYTITLTVTDAGGLNSSISKPVYIP